MKQLEQIREMFFHPLRITRTENGVVHAAEHIEIFFGLDPVEADPYQLPRIVGVGVILMFLRQIQKKDIARLFRNKANSRTSLLACSPNMPDW